MMTLDELVRKVQKIEVFKDNIPHKKLSGQFNSPYKGSGLATDYIRKYEVGDDVRDINWNVTARFREPYVNTFTEDKERLIWIMVDVSSSLNFGSVKSKLDAEIEIAATLAYSSLKKSDAVGAIFFSDKVETLIKPAKGMANFWRIAKALVEIKPIKKTTNLLKAVEFAGRINNRKSIVFLLSDFIVDDGYGNLCKILGQKNDLTAIRIYDKLEGKFPALGWIKMHDAETGAQKWINTSSKTQMSNFNANFASVDDCFRKTFSNSNVNALEIATDENYILKLYNYMNNGA